MILTNRFEVTYNMENIDRDFDIFLVEKSENLYKTNILDILTLQLKALSVQYSFKATCLVLFRKGTITAYEFRRALMEKDEDVKVKKIDILNEDEQKKQFYYKNRLLLQLLVNSLKVPKMEKFSYNNISGKLYYGDPSWISHDKETNIPYSLYMLQISFDPGMYLNLDVKTFRKGKSNKKPYYLFDPVTGIFRRKLQSDPVREEDLFIESSFANSRNTVTYLDFASFGRFRKCKLGIMEQFLFDVRKKLGDYVTLTKGERTKDLCYKETKKEKESLSGIDYRTILMERGIHIVDACGTDVSAAIAKRIEEELSYFYNITATNGELDREKFNIRLIHNTDYYTEKKLTDEYLPDHHGMIIQHMAIEDQESLTLERGKNPSPVIIKILTELIIKDDVHNKKIRIYNWEQLSSEKDWTFVMREKIKKPERKDTKDYIIEEKEKPDHYTYYCLTIDRAGNMEFLNFNDIGFWKTDLEKKIRIFYDTMSRKMFGAKRTVEGLVFTDIDNMHAIIRTKEKTMPETAGIQNALKETNGKDSVAIAMILEALKCFDDHYPTYREYTQNLLTKLQSINGLTVRKGELKKMINMLSKAGKYFNRFLHDHYGIWICPEMKNLKDFEDPFMLTSVTDIKYFIDTNTDGENICSFNYYAGPAWKNLQTSIHNACVIRQVRAEKELEFETLLPLMAVDFVRIGMYTVIPFPFKLLREYIRM